MSNYIPHYTKKLKTLSKRERTLTRGIQRNVPFGKLIVAAKLILDARVRVLKARRALLGPTSKYQDAFSAIDESNEETLRPSPETLLKEFGYSFGDPTPPH